MTGAGTTQSRAPGDRPEHLDGVLPMVGYTALMQADERLAVDKRDRYVSALASHHDAFGGTIVQRLGDGTMSMFPSALDAVLARR